MFRVSLLFLLSLFCLAESGEQVTGRHTTTTSHQIDGGYCTVTTEVSDIISWVMGGQSTGNGPVTTGVETSCVCVGSTDNPFNPRNPITMCRATCPRVSLNTKNTYFCSRRGAPKTDSLQPSCPPMVCSCKEPGDDLCFPVSPTPSPTSTVSGSLSQTASPSFGSPPSHTSSPSTSGAVAPRLDLVTLILGMVVFWAITSCIAA